jgi:hypothetical protein
MLRKIPKGRFYLSSLQKINSLLTTNITSSIDQVHINTVPDPVAVPKPAILRSAVPEHESKHKSTNHTWFLAKEGANENKRQCGKERASQQGTRERETHTCGERSAQKYQIQNMAAYEHRRHGQRRE